MPEWLTNLFGKNKKNVLNWILSYNLSLFVKDIFIGSKNVNESYYSCGDNNNSKVIEFVL